MGRIIASMLARSNLQVLMAKFGGSVQFTPGLSLGNNSAEADDEFLSQCFVTTHAYEQLVSLDTTKMIAAGRTGSGKTAKLLQIKQMHGKIAEIDPVDMSIDFISNSNILQFLQAVGADLDLLFQVLWKHVLCVEYVRLRHSVNIPMPLAQVAASAPA